MRLNVRYPQKQIGAMLAAFFITVILTVLNLVLIRKYGTQTGYIALGAFVFAAAAVLTGAYLVHRITYSLSVDGETLTYRNGLTRKQASINDIRKAQIVDRTRRTEYIPNSFFFRGSDGRIVLYLDGQTIQAREGMEDYQKLKELLQAKGLLG